jgi:hypothetical protein
LNTGPPFPNKHSFGIFVVFYCCLMSMSLQTSNFALAKVLDFGTIQHVECNALDNLTPERQKHYAYSYQRKQNSRGHT